MNNLVENILFWIERFFVDVVWIQNIFDLLSLDFMFKTAIIYFLILWISIIIWVTKDITNRTNSLIFQIISIIIVLFWTPLWVVVYLLIRPSRTLFEKYYEDSLWDDEEILSEKCFECKKPISRDFKFCPSCKTRVKTECKKCKSLISPKWKNCPYCWEEKSNLDKNLDKKSNLDIDKNSDKNKDSDS